MANRCAREVRISRYRTEHGAEVDLIVEIGRELRAVEVKAARSVTTADLRGLQSFREDHGKSHRTWIRYQGTARKELNGVENLPWQEGICEMFGGTC